jgi:hypothetical protein
VINVENLDLLNFRDQTLPESISGIIFNIFDVKHKVEAIFSTGQSGDKTSKISKEIDFISESDIEKYNFNFQFLEFFDIGHADAIIFKI